MTHPAKFNLKFLPIFAELLFGCAKILDPFSGSGRIKNLEMYGFTTIGIEIEPEWATMILGDSSIMPIRTASIDGICTSPTYGNRMADSFIDHKPEKKYVRNTYHHHLNRKPSKNNTGLHHFGKEYLELHNSIYKECVRVLKPYGKFVINTKNFIHSGKETDVTTAHISLLQQHGFILKSQQKVYTTGNTFGENRTRVNHENITLLELRKGEP